ncbi:MAG: bifunctional riboflavin kinase/FMN adenylyltransferase [Alphaproteobacteria bacterium]|nr:bifunctional riboflavin kinase/FMN adenylyltransferase [Alphaproteobacteria bacterium]
MTIFYSPSQDFPDKLKGSIIAIGNFDGIHKGHCALFEKAKEIANAKNCSAGVLTFEPHPRSVFQAPSEPFRITPINVKRSRIEHEGMAFLYELDFTRKTAQSSAKDFISNVLKGALGTSHVVIGYDFHFGKGREGNVDTLKEAGIEVSTISPVQNKNGQKYSASTIRSYLRRGMIDEANDMLGWEWHIQGEVIHGDKRGRELGYPTANILLDDTLHPSFGIYATLVQIEGDDKWLPAATNIGIRPMFETPEALVEAHLLDFEGDLYGKTLKVKPVQKIRDEARFDSLDDLVKQMDLDCRKARKLLA